MKALQTLRSYSQRKLVQDTLVLQLSRTLGAGLGVLSVILVTQMLGVAEYGRWGLLLALNGTWSLLDLSGITYSIQTRLAIALGGDTGREEITDLLAQYLLFSFAWAFLSFIVLSAFAPAITRWLYAGDVSWGLWSGWLSLRSFAIASHQLALTCFRSHRKMRLVALLQSLNQLILLGLIILVLQVEATVSGMVFVHVALSWLMMVISALILFGLRARWLPRLPTLRELIARLPRARWQSDWQFGVMLALDKNLGSFFLQIALLWVGSTAGNVAVGTLKLAMQMIERLTFLSTGLFENMSAIIPRLVGAGEFRRLWITLRRVLLVLLAGSLLLNGLVYLVAPSIFPLLFGAEWLATVPILRWLLLYATIATVTGVFGPLYRAQRQVRWAALAKLASLALASLLAYPLIRQQGALGGAIYIILLYTVSGALTARFTLAELRRRAFT